MKRTNLFILLFAAFFAASCNQGQDIIDDITDSAQDVENTNADFSYSVSGRTVTFTISGDAKLTTFDWAFGDRTDGAYTIYGSTQRTATHTYSADGTYKVMMVAHWTYKGHTQKKTIEKTITIGNGGSGGGGQTQTKKAFVRGFIVYSIPANNYYYSIKLIINEGMDYELTITMPDKELKTADLPYSYELPTPVELAGKNAFAYYNSYTLYAYNHFYFWQSPELYFYEIAYTSDLKDKLAYTYGSGNTQIAVLLQYED